MRVIPRGSCVLESAISRNFGRVDNVKESTRIFKIVSTLLLFLILIFIQITTIGINNWTIGYMSQAVILNLFILVGIYAFRGFDYNKSISFNYCLVSFITGTIAGSLVALIPVLLFYRMRLPQAFFNTTILTSSIINPVIFHLLLKAMIKSIPVKNFLVIGKKSEIESIMREIEEKSMGKVKAYMYMNPSAIALEREIEKENIISGIIIADPCLVPPVEHQIEQARRAGISIGFLPNIVEEHLKRIPLEVIDKFRSHYDIAFENPDNSQAKRVFDVIVAIVGLLLTFPITLILAIAIPIESGFPIIFSQMRIGYKTKPFRFIKFRSLKTVGKKYLDEHKNPNDTIETRNTKIGKVIRKIRFDEIPQFWNVLTGTMSVIGPRPEMENYHRQCVEKIPYYSYRLNLRPGITGWAQINYKHTSGMDEYKEKTEYDLYYIKNRNMFMDLEIAMKTLETMIGMRGSK